jgi:DHA1 family bicyclomycin/chloramphenicol resistance-like MFS transporter
MEMLRRPESMSFVLIGCVTYGGLFAIIAMLAFILRDSFSLSATTAGWMLGATSIATWFGATLNHRLTGRMSVRRRLTSSTALSASSGLATLVGCWLVSAGHIGGVHGLAAIFVPMLIYTFSFGMTHPTTIVMSLQPLPHIAGTASALGASFQILSGALFVWTAGRLYDGTPAGLGYCVAAAGLFVFAMQVFVASRYSGK